jgi:glycosyltransferase involved in cell wall biosynthesis
MKKKAVFLTNNIYIDQSLNEGGVRLCTKEYIDLLSKLFDVSIFTVQNKTSLVYRIQVKLGINQYSDFSVNLCMTELNDLVTKNNIKFVFLNQSNTAKFGLALKKFWGNKISIFICSHGNESGDLLHSVTRFNNTLPIFQKILANWTLGRTIRSEVRQRANGIDGVLAVSEVEFQIENWLGAKKVFLVPRTITMDAKFFNGTLGIVGFIGDLSHAPNYQGIKSVCDEILAIGNYEGLSLRIVGSSKDWGMALQRNYPFVNYLGYLKNEELEKECESWSFFLNPVFYYSRGVSTKLAKALGMGLPVITTSIGNRGYKWSKGTLPMVHSPKEMANAILELAFDIGQINYYRSQVIEIVNSSPTHQELAGQLEDFIS